MVQFDVKRVQKGVQSFMVSFDFTKTPITQIADYIIIAGSKNKASDIHFDPRDEGLMVRFRMDGDLQDYTFVPKAYEKNLSTRLKLLANMNITESRLPQDGAIKGDYGGTYLDMRVSALPTNLGEKIVIRILDYTRSLEGVDTLGFHPDNLKKINKLMRLPNGIILTTGATGSGKSTTTYSILQGLNKPEKNIITVEDPIEMNIEGINQVQVNSEIGMTFAAALRSILRQDPNIVLIGEIRDSETAQIAVRTSITGHLVLSTIHTNNALSTIERLLDMDVERYLLSTALSGIISQRLAKTLCPECRYVRETTPYEKKIFKRHLKKDVPQIYDANPKGCENCRGGYKGRLAFHEVLEIDDDIRNALNNEKLEKEDLRKMVYTGKTITMLQDALMKCLNGETSFQEVFNAIEIEADEGENYQEEVATVEKEAEAIIKAEEEKKKKDNFMDDDMMEDPNEMSSSSEISTALNETKEEQKEEQPQQKQTSTAPQTNPVPVQPQPVRQQTTIPIQSLNKMPVPQAEQSQQIQNSQTQVVSQPILPVNQTQPVQPPIGKPVIPTTQVQQTVQTQVANNNQVQQPVQPLNKIPVPQQPVQPQVIQPQQVQAVQQPVRQQPVVADKKIEPLGQTMQINVQDLLKDKTTIQQPLTPSTTIVKPVVQYPNQQTVQAPEVTTTTTNPNVINNMVK